MMKADETRYSTTGTGSAVPTGGMAQTRRKRIVPAEISSSQIFGYWSSVAGGDGFSSRRKQSSSEAMETFRPTNSRLGRVRIPPPPVDCASGLSVFLIRRKGLKLQAVKEKQENRTGSGEGIKEEPGLGQGEDAVGGLAGNRVLWTVMDGGVAVGAPVAVEAFPFGAGEVALGRGGEEASERPPRAAEACGIGVEGAGAGEEGGVEGVEVAALRLEGTEVQAADAAIGSERDPERFIGLRRPREAHSV